MNDYDNKVWPKGTMFEDGGVITNVSYYKMNSKLTAVRYILNDNTTSYKVYPNNKGKAFPLDANKVPSDLNWHDTNKTAQQAIVLYADEDDAVEQEEDPYGDGMTEEEREAYGAKLREELNRNPFRS